MERISIPVAVLVVIILFITGCQSATTPAPTSRTPASVQVSPKPAPPQPVSGGTLRHISPGGPRLLSYIPEMNVTDVLSLYPAVERLMDCSDDRSRGNGLEPVLAEKVDDDIENKMIIFHLRKGVKFHDGSDLNADAVIWNYQREIDSKKLPYASYLKAIKKLDDLTIQFDYTEYNNMILPGWGQTVLFSKAAWDKASGGDLEKGKEWARKNVVGTGPFMLKEFVRDDHLFWVKSPGYRAPGKPYLDAIETRYVPEATTARAVMLSGGADYWFGATIDIQREMVDSGFIGEMSWYGLTWSIWPNTASPKSRWNDIRLRQALEYALDKPAIAKAFGFGYAKPMTTIANEGEWGYDPDYPARNYDPDKARRLLKDAGYPDGLSVKLLIASGARMQNIGAAIKSYLDAVGFRIDLDIADPGRFNNAVFGPEPGPDLSLMYSGMGVNGMGTYMGSFSQQSRMRYSYLGHSAEKIAMEVEATRIPDVAGQKAVTRKLMNYLADNALIIPVYWVSGSALTAPYVHPVQVSAGGFRWRTEELWMEKH